MAAVEVTVTSAPAAISGLSDGTLYRAQNVGDGPIRHRAATAAVTDTDGGWYVPVYGTFWFHKVTGEEVYVWAVQSDSSVWYDEVPST